MPDRLPLWMQDWFSVLVPAVQLLLVLAAAWVLQRLTLRIIRRLGERYSLPAELLVGARRITRFVIYGAALLIGLERMGVSATVVWTAFASFAAVAAVAFFAAWSVLSNIFCAMLIFTTRPFRLFDYVELVEGGDKPGLRGQVIDINLVYTTLQDVARDGDTNTSVLQIPNSLFFQRSVRRWRGSDVPRRWLETAT